MPGVRGRGDSEAAAGEGVKKKSEAFWKRKATIALRAVSERELDTLWSIALNPDQQYEQWRRQKLERARALREARELLQ